MFIPSTLLLLLKKIGNARLGEGDCHPMPPDRVEIATLSGRLGSSDYQSEDPSPTLPTYRGKEEKGKIVEDKKVESN